MMTTAADAAGKATGAGTEAAGTGAASISGAAAAGATVRRAGAPSLEEAGGPLGMTGASDAADVEREIASPSAEIVVVAPESAFARGKLHRRKANASKPGKTL
jgi:hypothetical protein